MPLLNGLETTRPIKREYPEINILVLTMYDHEEYFRGMLEAGASGYIIKRAAATGLVSAIRSVSHGEAVLSSREREVLLLIAEGRTSREIAGILNLSVKTVQSHRTNLMQKLDLHDRGDLVKYAIQKKIIAL